MKPVPLSTPIGTEVSEFFHVDEMVLPLVAVVSDFDVTKTLRFGGSVVVDFCCSSLRVAVDTSVDLAASNEDTVSVKLWLSSVKTVYVLSKLIDGLMTKTY